MRYKCTQYKPFFFLQRTTYKSKENEKFAQTQEHTKKFLGIPFNSGPQRGSWRPSSRLLPFPWRVSQNRRLASTRVSALLLMGFQVRDFKKRREKLVKFIKGKRFQEAKLTRLLRVWSNESRPLQWPFLYSHRHPLPVLRRFSTFRSKMISTRKIYRVRCNSYLTSMSRTLKAFSTNSRTGWVSPVASTKSSGCSCWRMRHIPST